MGHTAACLERRAVVPQGSAHVGSLVPKVADEPAHVRACTIPLQNLEAALPIHRIERLLQVNKDPIEGGLFDVGKLLHQLCLNHCGTSPPPIATAVKAVGQGDCLELFVYHLFNDFPYRFEEADSAMIVASF